MKKFNSPYGDFTMITINGIEYFIGVELCRILELENIMLKDPIVSRYAILSFDPEVIIAAGFKKEEVDCVSLVSELGLYILVTKSKMPKSIEFQDYVRNILNEMYYGVRSNLPKPDYVKQSYENYMYYLAFKLAFGIDFNNLYTCMYLKNMIKKHKEIISELTTEAYTYLENVRNHTILNTISSGFNLEIIQIAADTNNFNSPYNLIKEPNKEIFKNPDWNKFLAKIVANTINYYSDSTLKD